MRREVDKAKKERGESIRAERWVYFRVRFEQCGRLC